MKKLVTKILVSLLLMFGINAYQSLVYGQELTEFATQGCVVGGFGIDAGIHANELLHGEGNEFFTAAGTNDWFSNENGGGVGIIDQSNAQEIIDLLSSGNNTYERRMAFPGNAVINGKLLIDGFYARDRAGGSGDTDLTIFGGGDKNAENPASWGADTGNAGGKVDIIDVAGHTWRGDSGSGDLYFAGLTSIREPGGQAYRDFELFVGNPLNEEGEFQSAGDDEGRTAFRFNDAGEITEIGDMIIVLEVDNDGVLSFEVRIWVERSLYNNQPSGLPFTFGDLFDGSRNNSTYGYANILPGDGTDIESCGYYNVAGETSDGPPWGVRRGSLQDDYNPLSVFEVGLNLSEFGIDPNQVSGADNNVFPYNNIVVKSRQSAAFTSNLADFAGPYTISTAEPASVGDFVWSDLNKDGLQDEGEPGVEGVTVNLLDDSGEELYTTTTDENGFYLFDDLLTGDYQIEFVLPEGYKFTEANAGDGENDSKADEDTGKTNLFTLESGDNLTNKDAGLVIPDITTIELQGACYRMLSSPGSGASYSHLFADIFTQGANVPATKDDHIQDGDPNVWVWPTDNDGNSVEGWQALSTTNGYNQGLDTEIPAGTGVLLSMFEIRSLEDPGDTGPFLIDLSAFDEHDAPVNVSGNFINQTPDGWTLAGNPFFTSVDFNQIYADSDNINGVVYIWDRDIGETGFGGWRTYSVNTDEYSETDGVGDIPDGKIHPYQGFFVQTAENGNGSPNLKFTNGSKSVGGEFYGKQRSKNLVRLELSGDRGKASTWIVFGESGSFDRLSNDAFEMEPMASDYMMLASRKADGTLFDIGHYPIPGENFEVPVSVETSIPGNYTITATDFEMMIGQDLYFVDKETNTTLPLDESFSYDFTISNGAAKVPSPNVNRCSMEVNQMSKSAGNDRFVITTNASANVDNDLPQDVSLKQNYPNPFNPTTAIQYSLPESANVSLEVYNMLGQRVASIAEGQRSAGTHTVDFDASHLTSGVYIYRLTAGSTVINKRMTLVK